MAPAAATRLTLHRTGGFGPFFASYGALILVWWVSVLLHEMGHAVGARLAGLEPYCLMAGGGPTILRRRISGVAVELRGLPGSGFTMIASPMLTRMKWRLLACYAGGPAVTVALLLIGLADPTALREMLAPTTVWPSLTAALVLVNGILLASVVIPLPGGSIANPRNDFIQIVGLPWKSQEQIAAIATNAPAMEFQRLLLLQRYDDACDEARRLLEMDPRNWIVRLNLGELMLFAGRHEEADREYRLVLDDGYIPEKALRPGVRALIANNAAWNLFMLGGPEAIETADQLSARAIADLPNQASVLGTRGAVLIEKGDLVEGEKLVRRALRLHHERIPKAANLACLAIAAARQGKPRDAERFIERARTMDEECDLIPRAERELDARRHV